MEHIFFLGCDVYSWGTHRGVWPEPPEDLQIRHQDVPPPHPQGGVYPGSQGVMHNVLHEGQAHHKDDFVQMVFG